MRILITGMGGALGTRVANLVEADPTVETVVGLDWEPPRRRIHRAEFRRVDCLDERALVEAVHDVDPEVIVHLGVYEPNARADAPTSAAWTDAMARAVLGAAPSCRSLRRLVVRSGIEVYGRRRGAPVWPDESVAPDPTSPYGRVLGEVEQLAAIAGAEAGVPVTALRFAPVLGSHLASPLGRYLRLPVVGVGIGALPFSLLHPDDAAAAVVAAIAHDHHGPVNVTGPGAISGFQAARMGGRAPLPIVGPGWPLARVAAELLGAPLPSHVVELLVRGRTADATLCPAAIGMAPTQRTSDVVRELYEWPDLDDHVVAGKQPLLNTP